jgi:RimJ/RimL family protein N-acetyltransferase
VKKGGLVYIQAFDTNDPSYKKNVEESNRVDERTFHREKTDSYKHYFTKTSLEDLFTGERIIDSTQSYLLDTCHGEPHYHGIVQLFVQVTEINKSYAAICSRDNRIDCLIGRPHMNIIEVRIEGAEKLMNLIKEVEASADYMLMEPGERQSTLEQQRKMIARIQKQENTVILAAENDGRLVGYLMAIGGSVKRTRHSAYLVAGILKDFRGQGVGTALFQSIVEWAKNHDVSRLELTAVTSNTAGIALYQKSGFEIEGTKRNSLIINGELHSEYYMSKLL